MGSHLVCECLRFLWDESFLIHCPILVSSILLKSLIHEIYSLHILFGHPLIWIFPKVNDSLEEFELPLNVVKLGSKLNFFSVCHGLAASDVKIKLVLANSLWCRITGGLVLHSRCLTHGVVPPSTRQSLTKLLNLIGILFLEVNRLDFRHHIIESLPLPEPFTSSCSFQFCVHGSFVVHVI